MFRRNRCGNRTFTTLWNLAICGTLLLLPLRVHAQSDRSSEPFHVAVFTPTTQGNTYWPEVHSVMRSAAASLKIEITIHEFDVGNRFAKPELGAAVLQTDPIPDAAIFSVAIGQAEPLMNIAEDLGIPYFLQGPLFPDELVSLGGAPFLTYSNWIGYFHEDEEEKGYLLARELIAAARAEHRVAGDGTVQVVGVGGDRTWYGSSLREAGLRRAVAEDPAVHLLQTVPTRWTPEEGLSTTTRLLERYPEVTVIWAASDQLAIGAAEALRLRGMQPGKDAFTGGLDLSLVGLQAVQEGTLTATVAAPPTIWAEILVCVRDYLHAPLLSTNNSPERSGTVIIFPPEAVTHSTALEHIQLRGQHEFINYEELISCPAREGVLQGHRPETGR